MPLRAGTGIKPGSIYLLAGEDEFSKSAYLEKIKSDVIGSRVNAFNYRLYYGKDAAAEELVRSLETPALTGGKKLIVLKELESFPERERAVLLGQIKQGISRNVVLVLLCSKVPAKAERLAKSIPGLMRLLVFSKPEAQKLSLWITEEFKRRGKTISRGLAESIQNSAEQDFGTAASIIEQVCLFAGKKDKISDRDVRFFLNTSHENSVFKLLDSVNGRDAKKALFILRNVLQSGSSPVQIIGLLAWHITRLMTVKRLLLKRIPRRDMFAYVKAGTYALGRLISQTERFTLDKLKDDLQILLDTDLSIKRSSLNGEFLLEALVVKLSS